MSNILIAMQSMETIGKRITEKGVFKDTTNNYDGYNYKATGMKIATLDLIMRNFTQINELSGIAVTDNSFILVKFHILVKHKNIFFD